MSSAEDMGNELISRPLLLRGRTLRNRIGFAPMGNSVYTETGLMTGESVEFYRSVAGGGTGLIVQGCAIVAPEARSHAGQLGIWSDGQIPGLEKMTRAVHEGGALIIAQLQHGGIRSFVPQPPSPSAVTVEINGKTVQGREMSREEIRQSQRQFLDAALRAVKAGYDGVELHASHGWLISSFLSPVMNHRSDEYGRDRLLYLRQTYESIRAAVPENFIVGVRMSGYVPDLKTGVEQAKAMDAMGFDYISVSVNYKIKWLMQESNVPDDVPLDPMLYAAREIKKVVSAPVFAAKGIRTGEQAEKAMALTGADVVLVGRGHLCDPAWAGKALRGEEPRRCLNCRGECRWRAGTARCPALLREG